MNNDVPEPDLEAMEPKGWDLELNYCEVDLEGELKSSLDELDEARELNIEYEDMLEKAKEIINKLKTKAKESKEEIGKLKTLIEGDRGGEIKLKEVEEMISNLKVMVEEEKRIEDCLNIKLNEKSVEWSKLEEQIVTLRKELEKAKEQIKKGLKLKGGSEILDEIINSQNLAKEKLGLGFEKGKSPMISSYLYDNFQSEGKSKTKKEEACIKDPKKNASRDTK